MVSELDFALPLAELGCSVKMGSQTRHPRHLSAHPQSHQPPAVGEVVVTAVAQDGTERFCRFAGAARHREALVHTGSTIPTNPAPLEQDPI